MCGASPRRPELRKHVTAEGDVMVLETEDNKNDNSHTTAEPGAVKPPGK